MFKKGLSGMPGGKNPEIFPDNIPQSTGPVPKAKSQGWPGIITTFFAAWLLFSFLIQSYMPDLFDIRISLLSYLALTGLSVCIRIFINFRSRQIGVKQTSAAQETDASKKAFLKTPLFRFIIVLTVINSLLFFRYANKPFLTWDMNLRGLTAAPPVQMGLLPALFSIIILTICFLEKSQKRKDQTIRIIALFGVAFVTLTYLLYLKTSFLLFWNREQFLLFGLSILGLGSYVALGIRYD